MLVRERNPDERRPCPARLAPRPAPLRLLEAADCECGPELVDAPDLGSGGATRAESSLAFRTTTRKIDSTPTYRYCQCRFPREHQ